MNAIKKLALFGGSPSQSKPFLFNNSIGNEEKRAVMQVLESGELSGFVASPGEQFYGGKKVRALQEEMAAFFGVKDAVAFNSATSGLHAAVYASGVAPGDEVITSPYTMSATSTAILMCGATPIFADIEDITFGLDPVSVESLITPQTRAILVVNIFGHAARLTELKEIADRHGLYLIEDNSQAPGAYHDTRYTGTVGHMGVFSFNRHKVMQSGEGGVVLTNDSALAERMSLFRNHGEVIAESLGVRDIANTAGLNLRMTEMEAAVALEQFKKLPALNKQRQELAECLDQSIKDIPFLEAPTVRETNGHVYYMYALKFDAEIAGFSRDAFVAAMLAEGCFVRGGYLRPTYLETIYQKKICFGADGFPFTANKRHKEISYHKGICPVCEDLDENKIVITAIMQPPQTFEDMRLFGIACEKMTHNSRLLREYGLKQVASS